ncbi:ubiquitin fusion degradation protein UFD1-domain-containing protein [Chytriomyces sp. MP71]|nr:ubiquitin fusion degradation protein UFD1-domain-containing protein [Chytriomyces sp. MP71]
MVTSNEGICESETERVRCPILHVLTHLLPTSDRLVLAPSVLEGILHSTGSSPLPKVLLFEVSSLVSNTAKVFGSVREFTALSNHVVQVSPSLAFRLNLGSGTEDEMDLDDSNRNVSVRCVSLPKCEYLKIAPLDPEYLEIPDLRALLESHLRQNYSTVLEQDTLVVSVQPSKSSSWKQIKEFRFRITEARPATACSCIDVDINLDVVPLDSNLAEEAVRRKFFGNQVDTEVEPVRELALSPNGSDSFQSAISGAYNVTLTPIIGDCDLFISTSGLETPNLQDHDYYNVDCGESSVSFAFGGDESTEDVPYVYLSVLGRESSSQFKLSVNLNSPTDPLVIDASAPISTNWDESAPADHSKCPNCFQNVPTRTITMHEAFCVRNNTTCTRCRTSGSASFIFKKSEFEGHWHCDACSHYCATAKGEAMDATAAALIALEALKQSALFGGVQRASYHLCVADVKSAKRRAAATALEPMGFHISWCVKALQETVDVDEKAITWLLQNAPNLNGK